MRIKRIILLSLTVFLHLTMLAQQGIPHVSPTATYNDDDGNETVSSTNVDGQAPLDVYFRANPSDIEGIVPVFEWHFKKMGEETELMVRYEEDTQYTFTDSGTTLVTLIMKQANNVEVLDSATISVTVYESKLSFPNAFSPNNGDNLNNTFRPKDYQSIVEFHAYIFNRWGQKLYEWTDPAADGWDGTYNGKDVKDGVYFLLCRAKGADGRKYNIRRDVNLLRGYTENDAVNE